MPRNATLEVSDRQARQLTAGPAERVFLFNHGPASITISGSASDVEPAEMIGPSIPPGFALPVSFPLIELFPGIAGVNRLWAIAGVGGANVFVSHA